MNPRLQAQGKTTATSSSSAPVQTGLLQRKFAGGRLAGLTGECAECTKKKRLGQQTKLKVSEPGDIYEQEADRISDQVMATPAHHTINGIPLRIQRFAGQSTGQEAAPASVDQALANLGRPLEQALRQDMEQRFGHDFSRVRVHSGAAAEQSAREIDASAYTSGHHIVFGEGRFSPGTYEGRRLLAHELTHVVQQSRSDRRRADQDDGWYGESSFPLRTVANGTPAQAGIWRQPAPAATTFITPELSQQLSDEEIDRHIQGVLDREATVAKGSSEAKTLADSLAVLEGELKRRGSASPVLVRTALIRGSVEVLGRVAADTSLNDGLFKAGEALLNRGVFDIFKGRFVGFAPKQRTWIDGAAQGAQTRAQSAPSTDRAAAFNAIAEATPKFLAAWGGGRLLEVWVWFLKMGNEILRNIPGHSVEHLLGWIEQRRNEIDGPMTELSSLDPAKVKAAIEALPQLFEKLDKEQKDLVALIQEGQENLRKILLATTIVQVVTAVASLRGLFTMPGPGTPPTGPGTPPTGLAPVAVGPRVAAIPLLKPIEWAEVMRRFLQAGLMTLPVVAGARQAGLLMATGPTPGGGGVPTAGTPPAATGGYTTPPKPRVSPIARPETAGTGGIASIDRTYDNTTGVSQTIIEGRLRPTLPQRAGLEDLLGPPLPNADRSHLVGRILGDEAAAGTLYSPSNFNRGVQLSLERALQGLEQEARASGGYVWYRASNQSHPRTVLNGKALKNVKYEFQIRLPDGRISKTVRIEFNDIVVPGTPVTKNQPGYTISAPFEGGVTP